MADWYVSSAAYAAIAAFVPSAVYSVGNIVKPTAPAQGARWAMRCTTAGTASTEPAWPTANNSTVTTGGATFTNVTGQSTYGWGAAAGDIPTLLGAVGAFRFAGGDRMFVSSDHAETQTAGSTIYGSGAATAGFSGGQVLSVNRAGSVPPVAADLTAGATCTSSGGSISIEAGFPVYHYGINYVCSGTNGIFLNSSYFKTNHFDTCQLYLSGAGSTTAKLWSLQPCTIVLYNSTLRFSATGQSISANGAPLELLWLNTPSAIAGATFPTTLFTGSANNRDVILVTVRGVDLSAITGTLVQNSNPSYKCLFDSCRIAPVVTRYNVTSVANTRDIVELVNCFDGTNIISESYQPSGAVTTERTITLTGGATDDVGVFSHKMVSNTNIDKYVNPLTSFWLDVENQAIGSAKTAAVEIISSASLNNDEISLLLEYQGTVGSSVASFTSSLPATVLTTASAVTSSVATWNASPATPIAQKLQVAFTPQVAGRVRGQVRLGKASTAVYINPVITVA